MMPDVANDDDDDDDAGVGGVEPPIPKGGAGDGVGDNSVAPLASFSSFTDDLLIRRAELLRDRRQQHPEQLGSAEASPAAADKGQSSAEAGIKKYAKQYV